MMQTQKEKVPRDCHYIPSRSEWTVLRAAPTMNQIAAHKLGNRKMKPKLNKFYLQSILEDI